MEDMEVDTDGDGMEVMEGAMEGVMEEAMVRANNEILKIIVMKYTK